MWLGHQATLCSHGGRAEAGAAWRAPAGYFRTTERDLVPLRRHRCLPVSPQALTPRREGSPPRGRRLSQRATKYPAQGKRTAICRRHNCQMNLKGTAKPPEGPPARGAPCTLQGHC